MKKIILYFLLLLLFTWLGLFIGKDSGYMLISYGSTTIETTLWVGIISLLIVFLVLYFLTRLNSNLQKLPTRIRKWQLNRKEIKARILLKKAFLATIACETKKATKALDQALKIKNNDLKLINCITYAYLAHKQGEHEKCDNYLSIAAMDDKKAVLEVELLRAKFQTQNKQWQEALITLNQVRKNNPKHKMLLSLLHTAYLHLKEWRNLQVLYPLLRRYKILSLADLKQLEKNIYKELLLENMQQNNDPKKIIKLWHKMPRSIHHDAEILLIYITFLREHNLNKKVEKLLFKFLPRIWDNGLLEQYSTLISSNPLKQLKLAEKWLQNHPQDAALLLCLGRICKQQKLWGKAINYLEQSLKISSTTAVYYELGQIMEMQNDKATALNYYRHGLCFNTKR